jgi:hypothetical protein
MQGRFSEPDTALCDLHGPLPVAVGALNEKEVSQGVSVGCVCAKTRTVGTGANHDLARIIAFESFTVVAFC